MSGQRKSRPKHAATLADVGRLAGVSATAASAVAEPGAHLPPGGCKRSGAPRCWKGGGLNDYLLEIFKGVLAAASNYGQNTAVFTLQNWEEDAARLPGLCDGRIDGLILMAPTRSLPPEVLPSHTPFVSIHANSNLRGVPNIESDEEHGAYEVAAAHVSPATPA